MLHSVATKPKLTLEKTSLLIKVTATVEKKLNVRYRICCRCACTTPLPIVDGVDVDNDAGLDGVSDTATAEAGWDEAVFLMRISPTPLHGQG